MPNNPEKYGTPDEENPEWTRERFARAKRFHELPEEVQAAFLQMKREGLKPLEERETLTLSLPSELTKTVRDSGPDWEKRIEEAIREKFTREAA